MKYRYVLDANGNPDIGVTYSLGTLLGPIIQIGAAAALPKILGGGSNPQGS